MWDRIACQELTYGGDLWVPVPGVPGILSHDSVPSDPPPGTWDACRRGGSPWDQSRDISFHTHLPGLSIVLGFNLQHRMGRWRENQEGSVRPWVLMGRPDKNRVAAPLELSRLVTGSPLWAFMAPPIVREFQVRTQRSCGQQPRTLSSTTRLLTHLAVT